MRFTLILENETGEQINMTTTANQYMTSEIDSLYPPAGTISTSTYAGMDGSYLNNAFIEKRNLVIYFQMRGVNIENRRHVLYDYTGFAIQLGYSDEPDSPFYENEAIQKVKLSNGIKALGNWLFAACRNLENIVLPRNLKRIGDLTFNRTAITSIEFPASLTTIGTGAFTASRLEKVYIPDTVKNFGRYAFFHCESLKSVNIQCEKTGSVAFSGCISLTDVTIGTGCKYIADSSFVYCDNLREITYEGTLAQWAEVGKGHLWDGHGGVSESVLERIQCTDGFMEYDSKSSVWKEVKN